MNSLLRVRHKGEHAHVGFVELFFDLVFVFAITQVSHTLLAHLTPLGALQAAMILGALWWAWIDTSWVTNWLDPETTTVRVMLFCLMGIGLVLATTLPEAFGEKGLVFGIAFALLQGGRSLFMLWAARAERVLRENFQRISVWSLAGGALWIAGGLVESEARLAVWSVALLGEFIAPVCYYYVPGLGRARTEDWTVEGAHMAERVGLFIIICLGESVLVTGATFAELAWTPEVIAAFAVAFLGTLAMWWIYFNSSHAAASEVIASSDDPGAIARRAYTYCPILIVAGIIVSAVGDELSLAHPSGHVEPATAIVLIGGPMLYLIGGLLAKLAVFGRLSTHRATGVAALAALIFVAPFMSPLGLAASAAAVLLAVAIWETVSLRSA
jgi:low temperature requirement protein LtrA